MKKKPLITKSGEVRELRRKDIHKMRPVAEVLPAELVDILPKRRPGQRGPQKRPIKLAVTLRYSQEVIDYFKSTGEGWQARMDQVLKEWIAKHPRK